MVINLINASSAHLNDERIWKKKNIIMEINESEM